MKRTLLRVIAVLVLAAFTQGLGAQTDDIEAAFKKPSAAEEKRLRAVLAEPVPNGAALDTIRQTLFDKRHAADALGDVAQSTALLRESVRLLPDSDLRFSLARRLLGMGQTNEGNELMRETVATAGPYFGPYRLAFIACDLSDQNKNDAAREILTEVASKVKAAERTARDDKSRLELIRASGKAASCLGLLEERLGHDAKALAATEEAERAIRKTITLVPTDQTRYGRGTRNGILSDFAAVILRKVGLYRAAGRFQDAEQALAELLRYFKEVQFDAVYLAYIYSAVAELRFSQREFAQSEQLVRKSDVAYERMGHEATHPFRTRRARGIFNALVGQQKWPEALQVVEHLDKLAGDDVALKRQVLFRFDRGGLSRQSALRRSGSPL